MAYADFYRFDFQDSDTATWGLDLSGISSGTVILSVTRAALTGFATATAGSNATTSAEPIVTYGASSNMSAERVTTSSPTVAVDLSVANQVRFNVVHGSMGIPPGKDGSDGADAPIVVGPPGVKGAQGIQGPPGENGDNEGSQCFGSRGALTGEVTSPLGSHVATVTRSTDFGTSPWTGAHSFVPSSGQAFFVNTASNTSTISGQRVELLANGTLSDLVGTATRDISFDAVRDFVVVADEAINITSNGDTTDRINITADTGRIDLSALQVRVDGANGGMISLEEASSTPATVTAGRGGFWVLNEAPSVPIFTSDTNVDHRIKLTGANTIISVSGTVNGAAIDNATSAIQCTGNTTLNGINAGYDGQAIDVFVSGNFTLTANHASGSATGSPLALPAAAAYGPVTRGGMRLIYDSGDVVWRIVATADDE